MRDLLLHLIGAVDVHSVQLHFGSVLCIDTGEPQFRATLSLDIVQHDIAIGREGRAVDPPLPTEHSR